MSQGLTFLFDLRQLTEWEIELSFSMGFIGYHANASEKSIQGMILKGLDHKKNADNLQSKTPVPISKLEELAGPFLSRATMPVDADLPEMQEKKVIPVFRFFLAEMAYVRSVLVLCATKLRPVSFAVAKKSAKVTAYLQTVIECGKILQRMFPHHRKCLAKAAHWLKQPQDSKSLEQFCVLWEQLSSGISGYLEAFWTSAIVLKAQTQSLSATKEGSQFLQNFGGADLDLKFDWIGLVNERWRQSLLLIERGSGESAGIIRVYVEIGHSLQWVKQRAEEAAKKKIKNLE
eukprot:TRINITY_DN7087_c0_g1_i1.p1 TRINITY_DN7087_c0_g1~~TRINITY_DN7087_c0_g1_i1.p1  ORF type:complete len:289 (+),score=25.59 TRINITY_DN7087_c0_g1_i1:138-1004(+)